MNLTGVERNKLIELDPKLLEGVEEQSYTILHCKYTTSRLYYAGWWVNIHRTSYLFNRITGKKLEMLHAINVPLAPDRKYLQKRGDSICFTLIFPKVPRTWDVFDFIESADSGEGFKIIGIRRNESSVYRVKLN